MSDRNRAVSDTTPRPGRSQRPGRSARSRTSAHRKPIRIVSGGQTGVDRAALDAAIVCGIEIGGWCPRGRRAEDGVIADRYPLHETPSTTYAERTRWNVRDSDATLIIATDPLIGGTALTRAFVEQEQRPVLVIDSKVVSMLEAAELIADWIDATGIQILNVAGPRESTCPGVYQWTLAVLTEALSE